MKDFIPYKEALALKELGFDERFMIEWDSAEMGTYYCLGRFNDVRFVYETLQSET